MLIWLRRVIAGRPPSGVAPDGVGHGGGLPRARRNAADPPAAAVHAHRVQGARRLPARQRRPPAAARGAERRRPRGPRRPARVAIATKPHVALVAPRPRTTSLTCTRRPHRTPAAAAPRRPSPFLPRGGRVLRSGLRARAHAPGLRVTQRRGSWPNSDAFTGQIPLVL